jgi:hypothetical protein
VGHEGGDFFGGVIRDFQTFVEPGSPGEGFRPGEGREETQAFREVVLEGTGEELLIRGGPDGGNAGIDPVGLHPLKGVSSSGGGDINFPSWRRHRGFSFREGSDFAEELVVFGGSRSQGRDAAVVDFGGFPLKESFTVEVGRSADQMSHPAGQGTGQGSDPEVDKEDQDEEENGSDKEVLEETGPPGNRILKISDVTLGGIDMTLGLLADCLDGSGVLLGPEKGRTGREGGEVFQDGEGSSLDLTDGIPEKLEFPVGLTLRRGTASLPDEGEKEEEG